MAVTIEVTVAISVAVDSWQVVGGRSNGRGTSLVGSSNVKDNSASVGIANTDYQQEPVTSSVQLSYQACVTAFLQTGLYLGFFSREIVQVPSA